MKRDIYPKLLEWKSSKYRKPLILKGARQVGKTFILKEFGRREYKDFIYLNFEENPDFADFFQGQIEPERIIRNLSIYFKKEINPDTTLIILDEIQESNRALNSLKYFSEESKEYHIVAAGSLIGIMLSMPQSFPVGKVNFLNLYPMTFLEFLDAVEKHELRDYLENVADFSPLPLPFHNELIEALKAYLFIGGMPEAVQRYRDTGDFQEARKVHREIIDSYILDFAKHASPAEAQKLTLIWNSIPGQLARENKKFIFTAIRKSARAREYESALQWLENAGLILRAYNITAPRLPLQGYKEHNSFKVFALDVGLLGAMSRLSPELFLRGDKLFTEFKGAFIENYVAQQLKALKEVDLFYWKSPTGKAEVDFVVEYKSQIFPLEVKAGINPKGKSLRSYYEKYKPNFLSRTTLLNLRKDGIVCNYPLYAINLFPELALSCTVG